MAVYFCCTDSILSMFIKPNPTLVCLNWFFPRSFSQLVSDSLHVDSLPKQQHLMTWDLVVVKSYTRFWWLGETFLLHLFRLMTWDSCFCWATFAPRVRIFSAKPAGTWGDSTGSGAVNAIKLRCPKSCGQMRIVDELCEYLTFVFACQTPLSNLVSHYVAKWLRTCVKCLLVDYIRRRRPVKL